MIYEYWLASLYKIDCNRRRQAVAAAGSAEALYRMPEKELFLFDLLRRIFISDLHKGVNVLLRYLACKVINILSKIK